MAARTQSPLVHAIPSTSPTTVLPAHLQFNIHLAFLPWAWSFSMDSKQAGESIILLGSILFACSKLIEVDSAPMNTLLPIQNYNVWLATELHVLFASSALYMLWTHSTIRRHESPPRPFFSTPVSVSLSLPPTPRTPVGRFDIRDQKRSSSPNKSSFAFLWMSVPKNYRDSTDDGALTGLLFGPLIAVAVLHGATRQLMSSDGMFTTEWRVEKPTTVGIYSALDALTLSRYNVVSVATLCSSILLFHIATSRWLEDRFVKRRNLPEGERGSVPRREDLRGSFYILFSVGTSLLSLTAKFVLRRWDIGIWQHLSLLEVVFIALFYQFTLYVCLRLAHRVFTLGELSLVCFGGTALMMEFLNINIFWPESTPFIKTYRQPTPLLIFQLALVAGALLSGFILSPILVLSRHIAQSPVRRLKLKPEDKLRQRRLLALAFYGAVFVLVFGPIGMWTRWCLGNRDPWVWIVYWLLDGRRKWSRPMLLLYWAILGSLSVAGWTRQLARNKRFRAWSSNNGDSLVVPGVNTGVNAGTQPLQQPDPVTGSGAPPLPSPPIMASGGSLATELLDAADKRVPTLKLNARRKSFHALTVIMFIPGIAFDPAFTHLSFSVAFALFTFAEYVRYFAIYPFGAMIHLFMNEFLDHRDNGTAILSHFYLLTGCAGSLWFEASTKLVCFTGVLVLGIGDALASIVGKKIGTHRWSPSTPKTLEGSIAFAVSIIGSAWILRLFGLVDPFSTKRYTLIVSIGAALEAFSDQNDNLTLPLYLWSMLSLGDL
ncbi:hypothetical protein CYLTODRAFT_90406 [Cylindrobasidium torrendii FP15055 ss-10]|uniref:dolichol kinase n=1 Tax=Cylindrobasidium torrendii FP15055 ss-10 TaxID=1314674 RepID=A0A0D7B4W8_9AGAR|nr:hypothetical protein CYLTODRAFT_90406 [Cylindrobasidium torrendii FP15055 ss-10]